MYGRNPPVIAYVVPIQNGAQIQDGSAQVFQAIPVSHSGNQLWASGGPGDQTRVMPPGQVAAQGQYAQYGIAPQQIFHQQLQQQQHMWGAPVQPHGLHPPQRVVTQNQWHVQQHRQVCGQGCANVTPQQSQQQQHQRRRQQQQQQPHGVALAVFQELDQQNHQQPWVSQPGAPLGSVPPNPSVQHLGRNVGRIPRPIHHVGPFGSPEDGSRGHQHNQHSNTHNRSQAKQKPWVKGLGEDMAPSNQHKAHGEPSSSGRANAPSGANGVDHGTATVSSGEAVAEGSRGEVGSRDAFFCEPCEKDFASEAARQAHLQSHEKCSEPGCNFSASRKVLNAHHSAAHGQFSGTGFQTITVEGQRFRVLLGTRPEDVEEWRASRRKHWPSDKTIVRKEEEERKRRVLGGLGPEAVNGLGRGGGKGGARGRGGKRLRTKGGAERGEHDRADIIGVYGPSNGGVAAQAVDSSAGAASEAPVTGKRPCEESSTGTSPKVPRIEGKERRGDSSDQGVEPEVTVTAVVGPGASTSGDGEEAEGVVEGKVSGDDSAALDRKGKKRICVFYLKGKCSKGEECTFDHDVIRRNCSFFMGGRCIYGKNCTFIHDPEARAKARQEVSETEAPTPADGVDAGKEAGERRKAVAKKMLSSSKQTLLRKLLAPQLHRESSIALQAVRFIVKSNFFLLDAVPSSARNACSSSGESACGAKESNGSEVTPGPLLEDKLSSTDDCHRSAEESSSTGVNAMGTLVDRSSPSAAKASQLEENVVASVGEAVAPAQENVAANPYPHPVPAAIKKAEASGTEASSAEAIDAEALGAKACSVEASSAKASGVEASSAEASGVEASSTEASGGEASSAEASGGEVSCAEVVNSEEKGIVTVTDATNGLGRDAIDESAARSCSIEAGE